MSIRWSATATRLILHSFVRDVLLITITKHMFHCSATIRDVALEMYPLTLPFSPSVSMDLPYWSAHQQLLPLHWMWKKIPEPSAFVTGLRVFHHFSRPYDFDLSWPMRWNFSFTYARPINSITATYRLEDAITMYLNDSRFTWYGR